MSAGSIILAIATLVRTINPTWEVVVADDVMEPPPGGVDAAPEIQRRIRALAEADGGTLFLKPGMYRIASPVTVLANVTVKGDYSKASAAASAVLEVTWGRDNEKGAPAFALDTSSGLQGLWFHYPDQVLESPSPYSLTVGLAQHPSAAPDNQTIRDCSFVNAWRAIGIGPANNELHTLRDVRICALKKGLEIDSTSDIGRIEDVEISPKVWADSDLVGSPAELVLRKYLLDHETVGADFGRSDWEYIWRLKADGYRVGCRFRRGVKGLSNAVMAECDFRNCGTGLELDALNDVGLAVYDTSFACRDHSVHGSPRFCSVAQFVACAFSPAPVNDGFAFSHFILNKGRGAPLRHKPMSWPRPRSESLFIATDFGLSMTNACNATALQRALDAAASTGGGTVYVPGGRYDFQRGVTVPSGVELRGNSAVPHHTAGGGSVFLVRYGAGMPRGEPFVSLSSGAGLRGLLVWYPENPVLDPVPYPWTVRSLGEGCWLTDVTIANAWQGVDFLSCPSSGHRISYLSGVAWRQMLAVGNSVGPGWVEDTLFNPHYAQRLPSGLPFVRGCRPKDFPPLSRGDTVESCRLRSQLEAHLFRNCSDERIRGTFVYAAMDGISFSGRNRATVLMHGSDTVARGMEVEQGAGSELSCALCQLTPYETRSGREPAGFHFGCADAGTSVFRASQLWVDKPSIVAEGFGRARFESANSLSGPVIARSGLLKLVDFKYTSTPARWLVADSEAKVSFRESGLFELDHTRLPDAPPVNLTIDCRSVRPLENQLAKAGGVKGAKNCFCRVENGELHFQAELTDPDHAYYYADIWAGALPVWPETVFRYRIKPINERSASLKGITFDFLFTDGATMRESGRIASHGDCPVGVWSEFSSSLSNFVGKTISRIMVRTDRRRAPGLYGACFDDIQISTRR